jgi:hypothetical protein
MDFFYSSKVFLDGILIFIHTQETSKHNPQARSEPLEFDHGGQTHPCRPHFFLNSVALSKEKAGQCHQQPHQWAP